MIAANAVGMLLYSGSLKAVCLLCMLSNSDPAYLCSAFKQVVLLLPVSQKLALHVKTCCMCKVALHVMHALCNGTPER